MGKFQDLTGKTFGEWKVLNLSEKRTGGRVHWDCECGACGKIVGVSAHNLTMGTSNNCGCVADKNASKRFGKDETGNRYGELLVIKRFGTNDDRKATWLVRCSCGKEYPVSGRNLRSGKANSCRECSYKIGALKNRIDISGNKYGILTAIKMADENDSRKWLFKCDCGGEIICNKGSVLRGLTKSCGCMSSASETEFKKILVKNEINFIPQKNFDGCVYKNNLKFDFYIPYLNLCIELDGLQHFKPIEFFGGEKSFRETQIRDQIKNTYCAEHNIHLLRIPYTQFKNIEQILIENNIINNLGLNN